MTLEIRVLQITEIFQPEVKFPSVLLQYFKVLVWKTTFDHKCVATGNEAMQLDSLLLSLKMTWVIKLTIVSPPKLTGNGMGWGI